MKSALLKRNDRIQHEVQYIFGRDVHIINKALVKRGELRFPRWNHRRQLNVFEFIVLASYAAEFVHV